MAFRNSLRPRGGDDGDSPVDLPKTKLRIDNDELQRLNRDGGLLLRLPLDDIDSIEIRRKFDPAILIFSFTGIGIGAVGWFVSEYNIVSVILYVVGILLVGFGVLGAIGIEIVIHTRDGVTTILVSDDMDEGECFVATVRQQLRSRKHREPPDEERSSTAFRE